MFQAVKLPLFESKGDICDPKQRVILYVNNEKLFIMSYHFSIKLSNVSFDDAIARVTEELKKEGFGILTQIDVKETLKAKIDVDFRRYKILGACNPPFAHKALSTEDKIGVFLPCNVVVQEHDNGEVEVSAVDPVASMMAVGNKDLECIAGEIQKKMKQVIQNLSLSL
jgi:uncharacterized protein (DUF302 family)